MQVVQDKLEAVLAESAGPTPRDLVSPFGHALLANTRRAGTIIHRVNLVAWIAAGAMPLCILADIVLLPWVLAEGVAMARSVTSLGFLVLALSTRRAASVWAARAALAALFVIPISFFLYANWSLADVISLSIATALAAAYTLLPFIVAAGIAIFPVTLMEGALLLLPIVAATAAAPFLRGSPVDGGQAFSALWLLVMIGGAGLAASVSQLHLLLQLLGTTARDRLTGAFTRRVGEELLDLAFANAERENKPLAVVLVDLDDFKATNDRFGHEAGDRSLAAAANVLALAMRRGDSVVRWGGDEFLMVLSNTGAGGARQLVDRICEVGFGTRLGGGRQTASLGIAERQADDAAGWPAMVRHADARARLAKQSGKDRCVGCDDLPADDLFAA
ncbi:MAG TPA: GGDEF domain-containing protein [Alphaproteobacteria bacterium]|nr:GGDEF domain-containing protein [Alphaproteobacteria bacterium]